MTATAVCSVSADPPTLLVCVNESAGALIGIKKSGVFAVNVLSDQDAGLAQDFSGRLTGEERFSTSVWHHGKNQCPVLADAAVVFECTLVGHHQVGSHFVVFGQVGETRQGATTAKTLLYGGGAYAHLSE